MTAQTVLYIIIAGVVAFALALYMYAYKTKYSIRHRWLFGSLRFFTLFALFLLLINPKFKSESFSIEKPNLSVLVDNSASIKALGQENISSQWVENLKTDKALNDKFEVRFFTFGKDFAEMDSLPFSEKQTNIDKALKATEGLFKNSISPSVLLTDGNQTFGNDYEFSSRNMSHPIYPIILGDSTQYVDLKLEQLNTNKYSFLKNEFPVEALLVYNGKEAVNSRFTIAQAGSVLFSEIINFSEINNTKTVTTSLPSTKVGLQRYTATIEPLSEEKNKTNNSKVFGVEVIDQATKVMLVSSIKHPDLGAIKKSIETNEQRQVTFVSPEDATGLLNDYQLVILYQPDRSFMSVFSEIEKLKKNTFTITGLQTDWNFLNSAQPYFNKESSNTREDVLGNLNLNYGSYALEDIGFSNFPPLQTEFGELSIKVPYEVLLNQNINGFSTGSPLFASMEINGVRNAIFDGEGLWKWRANSYLKNENFEDFDTFFGKMVQYLASNKSRTRLEVTHETFYYNNNPIVVSAQYFDKSFVFDNRAQLEITVIHSETKEQNIFPLLLKNNYYEVDLNSLPQGDYSFTVSVKGEAVYRSGNFTILDFQVENQFLNANVTKLKRVATNTGGTAYFSDNFQDLKEALLNNESFVATEKSQKKIVPLIDWKYLLALIALLLSAEWIIRKYNGLI
ncbi:MAG: VWA domain-containing protein [Flavobacteriaceae bacterium]